MIEQWKLANQFEMVSLANLNFIYAIYYENIYRSLNGYSASIYVEWTSILVVQSIFEEEMSVIQTRVKRNEEIHEFISRQNFD